MKPNFKPGKKRRKFDPEQKCPFCIRKVEYLDYKDTEVLEKYITPYGKMFGRKKTGVCASHQRQLTAAIKRARILGLLPFVGVTLKD
jgi:small subunit ribosomal protein S18